MRAREFLLEYRRDKTAEKLREKLLARNRADMTRLETVEEILERLESADPSNNKQYTQWIANRYIAGDFFLEDLEIVKRYLDKFIEAKNKRFLDIVDLGQYSLGSLKEKINQVFPSDDEDVGMSGSSYLVIPGTKVLYNGSQGQFAIMSTLEGSMQHNKQVGEFAEWCTADSRAPKHYQEYASQGPLYVYVNPEGKKYQFHFPTGQMMNKLDSQIGKQQLAQLFELPFIQKNIDWQQAVQKNGMALDLVPEKLRTSKICLAAVKQNGMALKLVPEELRTPELCLAAVQQYGMTLDLVPEEQRTLEVCLAAVKQNGIALHRVPRELRTPELCMIAVKQNPKALGYVPQEIRDEVRREAGL